MGLCTYYIGKLTCKERESIIELYVVTTLVKNQCNKVNKGKIINMVMRQVFQAECWKKT